MAEKEIIDLLKQIEDRWPELHITKDNLIRPTREMVLKFYTNCFNDCNEKISYLTRSSSTYEHNTIDLTPEERLFQQLSRVLGRINLLQIITLLDIYQPTQKGTKALFKVCCHFQSFMDILTNEIDLMGNEMFKTKEEEIQLSNELQELRNEIEERVKIRVELSESKQNLSEQLKSIMKAYKEMTNLRAAKEKLYAEKKRQREHIQWNLQKEEAEWKHLEAREEEILKQRVTASDYQNILHTLETLKMELEKLGSDKKFELLELENKTLVHTAECIKVLSKYDFGLEKAKELTRTEDNLKAISNAIEKLQSTELVLKQERIEIEQRLQSLKEYFSNLNDEHRKSKNLYQNYLEQNERKLVKLKEDSGKALLNSESLNSKYKEELKKLEEDQEKLRNTFKHEYIRVSHVEKRVVNKFTETLMKFRDLE